MKTFFIDFGSWTIKAENENEALKIADKRLKTEKPDISGVELDGFTSDSTTPETPKLPKWWFTFGSDHMHPHGYIIIEAEDWQAARDKMFDRFGREWSMEYNSAEAAGVEKFGLKEIQ